MGEGVRTCMYMCRSRRREGGYVEGWVSTSKLYVIFWVGRWHKVISASAIGLYKDKLIGHARGR